MSTVRAPRRHPVSRPRLQPADPRPDLRVVDDAPVARRRVGAATVTVFATVVVFVALFGLAVFHTWLVQNQQHLDQMQDQVTEAQADYERLRLEVATLESPERVVSVAVNELGMVPPPETTYLTPSEAVTERPALGEPEAAAGDPAASPDDETAAAEDDWGTVKPFLDSTP